MAALGIAKDRYGNDERLKRFEAFVKEGFDLMNRAVVRLESVEPDEYKKAKTYAQDMWKQFCGYHKEIMSVIKNG